MKNKYGLEIKRFVLEYANYENNIYQNSSNVNKYRKEQIIKLINRAIELYENGYLSIKETMNIISNAAVKVTENQISTY